MKGTVTAAIICWVLFFASLVGALTGISSGKNIVGFAVFGIIFSVLAWILKQINTMEKEGQP